jgi:hypothetical protein
MEMLSISTNILVLEERDSPPIIILWIIKETAQRTIFPRNIAGAEAPAQFVKTPEGFV